MKKILILLFIIFTGATYAETISINWLNGNSVYATSTCTVGDDLILPAAPTPEYGYHFTGWTTQYTFLEYIESTGTQYIDTGLSTKNFDISVKYEFTAAQTSTDQILFGSTESGNLYYLDFTLSGGWVRYGTIISPNLGVTPVANRIYTVDVKNGVWYMDDSLLFDASAQGDFTSSVTFKIFKGSSNFSNYGKYRCYSFEIKENNTLVRNFIPAKRLTDNAIGMYDTVTNTFFTNAGTGEFIAGPVAQ